nr:unnamed protein product [Callosobruchus analis]
MRDPVEKQPQRPCGQHEEQYPVYKRKRTSTYLNRKQKLARRYRILIFFGLTTTVYCEREHKVHNIVLYPEKHSWCQITPIQQIVGSPGYEPVTIDNNVCVGACYSYSIPKTQPAEPEMKKALIFPRSSRNECKSSPIVHAKAVTR